MNVILVVADTLRRDRLGAYGGKIHTPNLDRFARMGTVFDNYYIGSFATLPCRNDILTGRYEFPWRGWGAPEFDAVTLSGQVRDAGRVSYFITDVYHHWGKDAGRYWADFSGFDLIRGQEGDGYVTDADVDMWVPAPRYLEPDSPKIQAHLKNVVKIRKDEEDWFAPQVFNRAAEWVQHNGAHKDFFLMVDSFDPHEPWDPPRHYIDMYADPNYDGYEYVTPDYVPLEGYLTKEEYAHCLAMYAAEITMVDRWFGRLLDQLEVQGLLKNTMVIFTTDHATLCGAHGWSGKGFVPLYQEISHCPLIVYHPEHGHGERRDQLVQAIDFFPTVLDAAGQKAPDNLHGKSLLPIFEDAKAPSPRETAIFGAFGRPVSITDGEWALHQAVDPSNPPLYSYSIIIGKWAAGNGWGDFDGTRRQVSEEDARKGLRESKESLLFHLPSDPGEERNLANERPEELRRMRKLLVHKFQEIDAPPELLVRYGLSDMAKA